MQRLSTDFVVQAGQGMPLQAVQQQQLQLADPDAVSHIVAQSDMSAI
jgi:hypothetical protein